MNAEEQRRRRANARARALADPSIVPHGTESGYCFWGCRCGICKRAHSKRASTQYQVRVRRLAAAGEASS